MNTNLLGRKAKYNFFVYEGVVLKPQTVIGEIVGFDPDKLVFWLLVSGKVSPYMIRDCEVLGI